jgi:hypothetical protein
LLADGEHHAELHHPHHEDEQQGQHQHQFDRQVAAASAGRPPGTAATGPRELMA